MTTEKYISIMKYELRLWSNSYKMIKTCKLHNDIDDDEYKLRNFSLATSSVTIR